MREMRNQDKKMAARPGFEPRQTEPESVVLPLHHQAKPLIMQLIYPVF